MYSGKDAAAYPTQWALNPTAYQNIDSSTVDWAALAQQWIAMKENCPVAIPAAPPPPSIKPDAVEEGEAPMDVEMTDSIPPTAPTPPSQWDNTSATWGNSWNQWSWNWPGPGGDGKTTIDAAMPPDGFPVPPESSASRYPTGMSEETFQHGYWSAPPANQNSEADPANKRRIDPKAMTRNRIPREKHPMPTVVPPVMEPIVVPSSIPMSTIDAAKRRQLPGWIREGLEKMEREKQRALERDQEKKAREEADRERKRLEEEELAKMKSAVDGEPALPAKSKFDSDSEEESGKGDRKVEPNQTDSPADGDEQRLNIENRPLIKKTKEEIMQEVMLAVRRSLTEILLEVTDHEIHTVSQEELARYNAAQASRLNAASKSKALAAIANDLGLGAYESSSEGSDDEEEQKEISDQQLQELIRRKRIEFERTSREIDAEVKRAEAREAVDRDTEGDGANFGVGDNSQVKQQTSHGEKTQQSSTPPAGERDKRRSATPPPVSKDTPQQTPEKALDGRYSKDKRFTYRAHDRNDKKCNTSEEKLKTPDRKKSSPRSKLHKNETSTDKESSGSSSDSEDSSSSSSSKSDSSSVREKKRKHRSSSESDHKRETSKSKKYSDIVDGQSKIPKSYELHDKSDKYSRREELRRKDNYKHDRDRNYEKSQKDKYRDESGDERSRKRRHRSRSNSHESSKRKPRDEYLERHRDDYKSSRRKRYSRDRESFTKDKSYDRYSSRSKYERSQDHDRYDRHERNNSRSGSHSRHRR